MKLKTTLFLALVGILFGTVLSLSRVSAATAYGNVNIINDAVMNNTSSMSPAQINLFLNGFAGTCLGTNSGFATPDPQGFSNGSYQYGDNVDAGTAVRDIAVHYGLNPQLMLVTLEKEQGLISRNGNCAYANPSPAPVGASCNNPNGTGPSYCSYACQNSPVGGCVAVAVGYGCPGYCRSDFNGFSKQISGGAWIFRFAEARAYGQLTGYTGYDAGDEDLCYTGPMTAGNRQRSNTTATCHGVIGNQPIYYDGSYTDSDGNTMYMANGATASMLNYTPFYARSYTESGLFHTSFTNWFGNPAYPSSNVYFPDGTYNISGAGSGKSIDVNNNSSSNGTNLQLYSSNGTGAQRWVFTRDSDGYYTIRNDSSGKYIDVTAASTQPGAHLQIWDGNGTCAQRWAIQKIGAGYTFFSTCSGLAIDVNGGSTANGALVQVYTPNSTPAQLWNIHSLDSSPVSNGLYNLLTAAGTALDTAAGGTADGTSVQIYSNNGTGSQAWMATRQSNGLYKLYNPQSGKYLDVVAASTTVGARTQIFGGDQSCAQEWAIATNSDGSYSLASSCSGLRLDVLGGATSTSGTPVQVYTNNGTSAQEWTLQTSSRTLTDGTYHFLTTAGTALDIPGGSTKSGTSVQIYSNNGTGSQAWTATRQSNGLYKLYNPQSGKYLDVVAAGVDASTRTQIWDGNTSCAQQWAIATNSDGSYSLASSCSGLRLDVSGGALATAGTAIQIYTNNNTDSQKWILH